MPADKGTTPQKATSARRTARRMRRNSMDVHGRTRTGVRPSGTTNVCSEAAVSRQVFRWLSGGGGIRTPGAAFAALRFSRPRVFGSTMRDWRSRATVGATVRLARALASTLNAARVRLRPLASAERGCANMNPWRSRRRRSPSTRTCCVGRRRQPAPDAMSRRSSRIALRGSR